MSKLFEEKIKPMLQYVGFIGAILSAGAYLIIIIVLIVGFKASINTSTNILYATINAAFGVMIMQLMKMQGITFAKNRPENKTVIDKYNQRKTKDRKFKSITRYWITTIIKDVLIKAVTIGLSVFGIVAIVVIGSQDYMMLCLALVNLIMFACLGILSMNGAYEYYNEEHIPYLIHKMEDNHDRN